MPHVSWYRIYHDIHDMISWYTWKYRLSLWSNDIKISRPWLKFSNILKCGFCLISDIFGHHIDQIVGLRQTWDLSTVKPVFKTTWEIGKTCELRTSTSVPRSIHFIEIDLRNKTTSEFRTAFDSPLDVLNFQVPLYFQELQTRTWDFPFLLGIAKTMVAKLIRELGLFWINICLETGPRKFNKWEIDSP